MNKNDSKTNHFLKEWLEKLQQESWQLELLISGFALFGIWEARSFLTDVSIFAREESGGILSILVGAFTVLINVGWKIFFINLLVHVILRALWIGAIGLRYVSGEIDYEELNYSEYFTDYLTRKVGSYDAFIERLEKFCSVLFSYTFLLFLVCMSGVLYMIFLFLPFLFLDLLDLKQIEFLAGIWIIFMLALGLIVFIDFITMGSIKRIKDPIISKIYFPLYAFFSYITLSFLYRPLIYNFVDHKYTKRLFLISIPYCLILIFHNEAFTNNSKPHFPPSLILLQEGYAINDLYYEDLYYERLKYLGDQEIHEDRVLSKNVRIGQFYNDKTYVKVFVKMLKSDYEMLSLKYGVNPFFKQGFNFSLFSDDTFVDTARVNNISDDKEYKSLKDSIRMKRRKMRIEKKDSLLAQQLNGELTVLKSKRDSIAAMYDGMQNAVNRKQPQEILNIYKELIQFEINGRMVDSLNCFYHFHPLNNEKGILFYIPVDSTFQVGLNDITIERTYYNDRAEDSTRTNLYKLPFYQINE